MERFSPKLEIVNHFDNLIHLIDIDIEEALEKYNENQALGDLQCFHPKNRKIVEDAKFKLDFFSNKSSQDNVEICPEATKVIVYLKQVRMRAIEELRKEQDYILENFPGFKSFNAELTNEEKRSQLFAENFRFQINLTQKENNPWIFNLFTFVTDFYISPSDIQLLEKFINTEGMNSKHIFDEKMVLTGLMYRYFCDNLTTQAFPNHFIRVSKQDLFKIKQIYFKYNISAVNLISSSIDLSNLKLLDLNICNVLEYIIIENLSSLETLRLKVNSLKQISIKHLNALKELKLQSVYYSRMDIKKDLFDHFPCIEILNYLNNSMIFEFYKFKKIIVIDNFVKEDSNLDILVNKFKQIKKLSIKFMFFDGISKLLNGHHFENLLELNIHSCEINEILEKWINRLAKLQSLSIRLNNILIIECDAFSSLKNLNYLSLEHNSIESLDSRYFSELINLETLCLNHNRLKSLDENTFSGLKNLKTLDLKSNELEILEVNSFRGLGNLKKLNLSKNKLSYFDVRVLDNLARIERIILSGNGNIFNEAELLKQFKAKFEF